MYETRNLTKKERVIAYIDGFNLYFGMLEAGYSNFKWLNLYSLVNSLLKPTQELKQVKYFTSRVSNDPDKQKRQGTFIEAIETTGIKIYYGSYKTEPFECHRCGNIWVKYHEKMTDVNIATHMLIDACHNDYDMAMLISGDSDLMPPIRVIHENFTNKRVFVAFPPKRHNSSIAAIAKGSMIIGRKKLSENLFPPEITKKDGFILRKPSLW